jgi:hypothetical protein
MGMKELAISFVMALGVIALFAIIGNLLAAVLG